MANSAQDSCEADWAYESPSNVGNMADGPPHRVQIAPVVVHYCYYFVEDWLCAGFGPEKSSIWSGTFGVTQPRHVAVLATPKQMAFGLGLLSLGKEDGFQVWLDQRIGESWFIKFMTDGFLQ
ncbi:hypothetical protein Acr_00g0085280 [Actinidia rufa]|uniref:Uncharacterized protein n=1 Tax=Actinidia rufa TaxID=165716 RepID=A0A7J0DVE3_9ERIC|nr:hypothetical protein Acr_00g0085280 [Actinidia rufa]